MRSPGGFVCSPGGLGDLSILPCRTVPRPGLADGAAATGSPESLGVVARDEDCVQVSLLLARLPSIYHSNSCYSRLKNTSIAWSWVKKMKAKTGSRSKLGVVR